LSVGVAGGSDLTPGLTPSSPSRGPSSDKEERWRTERDDAPRKNIRDVAWMADRRRRDGWPLRVLDKVP
jgi:hypothetical protein